MELREIILFGVKEHYQDTKLTKYGHPCC